MALVCLKREWDTKEHRRDRPSPLDASHLLPFELCEGPPTMSEFTGGFYIKMPNVEGCMVHLAFH